jgi:hypothetical protein
MLFGFPYRYSVLVGHQTPFAFVLGRPKPLNIFNNLGAVFVVDKIGDVNANVD